MHPPLTNPTSASPEGASSSGYATLIHSHRLLPREETGEAAPTSETEAKPFCHSTAQED